MEACQDIEGGYCNTYKNKNPVLLYVVILIIGFIKKIVIQVLEKILNP